MRAGAFGLSLLADPLDVQVLQALEGGALPLVELRRAVGSPPETTLRKHLNSLTDLGVVTRTRGSGFSGAVSCQLSPSGRELLMTTEALSVWLAASPGGQLRIGSRAAKSAVKALVDGWSTKIMRALAAKPLSLTELDRLLSAINYPALERRLGAMRFAGQIVPAPGRATATPYRVTRWLREAVVPLASAASWERGRVPDRCEPFNRLDVETVFLLVAPMMEPSSEVDGTCRLAVEISNDCEGALAGVVVTFEHGRLTSCLSDPLSDADGSAVGSVTAWLDALAAGDWSRIHCSGRDGVAESVTAALATTLASQTRRLPVG